MVETLRGGKIRHIIVSSERSQILSELSRKFGAEFTILPRLEECGDGQEYVQIKMPDSRKLNRMFWGNYNRLVKSEETTS